MYNSLRFWLPALPQPDVIHFNSGIWECVHLYGEKEPFYTTNDYVRDVLRVYRELNKLNVPIVFATTTPILKHDRLWDSEVTKNMNAVVPVLKKEGCIINDLNSLIRRNMQHYIIIEDGCHLTEAGAKACAEAVCNIVEPYLK